MKILQVENLSISFLIDDNYVETVSRISFDVEQGEITAIVGESGCGKSVSCMALARLLPEPQAEYPDGKILFTKKGNRKAQNTLTMKAKELLKIRGGEIAYIFQEPSVSLNPVFRIGDQIAESIKLHRSKIKDIKSETVRLLGEVGIPAPHERIYSYPHELSGGMQQRVMIAMALASKPELLVADEPTTALDVTIQAQILDLLKKIRDESGRSIIIVTHNLGIVSEIADRVAVMYAGQFVEKGKTEKIINNPQHPYTKALLEAVPKIGHKNAELATIKGKVPSPAEYPEGCRFFDRCPLAAKLPFEKKERCKNMIPEIEETVKGHYVRCPFYKINE